MLDLYALESSIWDLLGSLLQWNNILQCNLWIGHPVTPFSRLDWCFWTNSQANNEVRNLSFQWGGCWATSNLWGECMMGGCYLSSFRRLTSLCDFLIHLDTRSLFVGMIYGVFFLQSRRNADTIPPLGLPLYAPWWIHRTFKPAWVGIIFSLSIHTDDSRAMLNWWIICMWLSPGKLTQYCTLCQHLTGSKILLCPLCSSFCDSIVLG